MSEQANNTAQGSVSLDFLRTFCGAVGMKTRDIMTALGYTEETSVRYMLAAGSAKLSDVRAVVGYPKDAEGRSLYAVAFSFAPAGASAPRPVRAPRLNMSSSGHLDFLWLAVQEEGLSKKDLAQRLGLNYYTVVRWFQNDDITMKRLWDIAAALGRDLLINVRPDGRGEEGGVRQRFNLLLEESRTINA